jgi:NAD(P)-dependent dehydrogenase (short-subunit alcohol dehydrogenase family)
MSKHRSEARPLAGRKALITGASSGIGADLARGFAAAGATVGICARREDRLADVLAACRADAPDSRMWVVDLSRLDEVADFALRADGELDGIDILVNNAGIPKRRHVNHLSIDEVDSVMAINYLSPVRLTLALLPRLVARGGGDIVNVSSVAARLGPPREAAYSASKAALTGFSESMAIDLWGTGVKLHVVNPGIIDTELFHLPDNEESLADLDALPASEVTDAVIEALRTGAFEIYVPGWFADIVAGKFQDTGAFLEGSAAWTADRTAALGQ